MREIQSGDFIWRCLSEQIDEYTTKNTVKYYRVLSKENNNLTITLFIPPINEWHKLYDYDDLQELYNIEMVISYKRPIFQRVKSPNIADRWRTLAYEYRWGDNGRVLFPYEDYTRSNPMKPKEWIVEYHPERLKKAIDISDKEPFLDYMNRVKEKDIDINDERE